MTKHLRNGEFYADGDKIFRAPVHTKVEGGTNISVGFPVCTISEYVSADNLVECLNASRHYDALVLALENARRDVLLLPPRSDSGSRHAQQIEATAERIKSVLDLVKIAGAIQEPLMNEPTPEQVAACDRAMAGLEAQADIWADEIDLVVIIKTIGDASRKLTDRMPTDIREGFINRQEANIDALVRQAYLEGFDRGGESRKEYDAAQVKAANHSRDELQAVFDLQWKADQRAIKRWQAAHPGNDLVWPDRADMVVWLMEQHTQTVPDQIVEHGAGGSAAE